MSKLTGGEPRHWHGPRGQHRVTDPRQSWRETNRVYWSPDDRAYAAHLEEHERLDTVPEPLPEDGPNVRSLFEHIESLEAVIAKERQIIIALRQMAHLAAEPDEKED